MRELAGPALLPLAAEDQTPVLLATCRTGELARTGIDFSMRPGQLCQGVMRLQLVVMGPEPGPAREMRMAWCTLRTLFYGLMQHFHDILYTDLYNEN